jgi:hypothetical protein
VNSRAIAPEVRAIGGPAVQKVVARATQTAKSNRWTVPNSVLVRVDVSNDAQLKVCVRADTQQFLTRNGRPAQKVGREWQQIVLDHRGAPDQVQFTNYELSGQCASS